MTICMRTPLWYLLTLCISAFVLAAFLPEEGTCRYPARETLVVHHLQSLHRPASCLSIPVRALERILLTVELQNCRTSLILWRRMDDEPNGRPTSSLPSAERH